MLNYNILEPTRRPDEHDVQLIKVVGYFTSFLYGERLKYSYISNNWPTSPQVMEDLITATLAL